MPWALYEKRMLGEYRRYMLHLVGTYATSGEAQTARRDRAGDGKKYIIKKIRVARRRGKNPTYTRYPSATLRLLLEAPAQQVGDAQKKQIRAELAKRQASERNPLPVGRYVTVRAKRLPNGQVQLFGGRGK